jgi:hypothetical protein
MNLIFDLVSNFNFPITLIKIKKEKGREIETEIEPVKIY